MLTSALLHLSLGGHNAEVRAEICCFTAFPPTFLRIISERIEPGEQARIPFP